jgi:hypothetical protein
LGLPLVLPVPYKSKPSLFTNPAQELPNKSTSSLLAFPAAKSGVKYCRIGRKFTVGSAELPAVPG